MITPDPAAAARLRLLADDLTGALDTAAEFVPAFGPVRVGWGAPRVLGGAAVAFDVASREIAASDAEARVGEAARLVELGTAEIAYLKLDSLLRGHGAREIAAAFRVGGFERAIVAPAFPYQKRVTRDGRQWAPIDGTWTATGEDLAAGLEALGLPVAFARPGETPRPGVTIFDAETDADLAAIAAAVRADPARRVLWCGSGGLAGALARAPAALPATPRLEAPILGLFGTDHPVTRRQLGRLGDTALRLPDGGEASSARLRERLARSGTAFVDFDLPVLDRGEAKRLIAREMDRIVARLAPPGTLVAGGGETLRAIADGLGATALDVIGRIVPGVPVARMVGGRWDGVAVVSKSGAFGDPDFLARLVGTVPADDACRI